MRAPNELFTIGLTSASGGRLNGLVDVLIAAPSESTPRIHECHILVGNALRDAVEQALEADDVSASPIALLDTEHTPLK